MGKKKPWIMRRFAGRGWVDTSKAPKWWLSRPDEVERRLRALKGVKVFEIGRSAGGRPIIAASWGRREDLPGRTSNSLASAVAGGSPEAFYGQGKRKRQSFLFLGAAHGLEIEGTVAAVNFLNVVVTGKDLRGRRWPRLAAAGRKLRIVIVPFLNMDGRERFLETAHLIGISLDAQRELTQGHFKDGEKLSWPRSKLFSPIPLDKTAVLGSYFNDNGMNLVYDSGMGGACQPETRALAGLLREEMPDYVLCSHSDNGSLCQQPDGCIPGQFRMRQSQIGALVGAHCLRAGMKKYRVPVGGDSIGGQIFYQTDMIYHLCGALAMLIEFPWGYQNVPDNHGDILDIGMNVIEEIAAFGVEYGFRPRRGE